MGYTVIGGVRSRAFRVLWMLEELGVPYTHVPAGPRSDAVVQASGRGKIPVLLDGSAVLTDSSAILTYLADRHSAFTASAGTVARAHQDAWTFRILDELEGNLWAAARHSFVLPEDQRVAAVKPSLKTEYGVNLARISDDMPGPFLMGDEMSVPDIVLTHCGRWAGNAGFPDGPAEFQAYLARMGERPALARVAAL